MSIGQNIKRRRLQLDMTLEDVAKRVGTSKQTISRYETGIIGNIPSDKIEALSEVLKTTPAQLMGWTEDNSPAQKDEAEREEFIRLYESAPAWLRDQVRSLLEAAEAGREARDGDPKAR